MPDSAAAKALRMADAFGRLAPDAGLRVRPARELLASDPLERLVPIRLLGEGLLGLVDGRSPPLSPIVLFFDRQGGGEGTQAARNALEALAERWRGVSFIHVALNTPARGAGTLVRNALVSAGARVGVAVHVVAHDRSATALASGEASVEDLMDGCDPVIVYAPGGAAGLEPPDRFPRSDAVLARAQLAVLSFPDPEALVSELPRLRAALATNRRLHAIRFDVEVEDGGAYALLGSAIIGPVDDADERLWVLVDNARRRCWRALVVPLSAHGPAGDPLVCPCRAAVERSLAPCATVLRVVPSGAKLVVLARGRRTLA